MRAVSAPSKGAGANARASAAAAVTRVIAEGVTLEAALQEASQDSAAAFGSAVRSLSYGAVRGFFRHDAILARLLAQPVRKLDAPIRALLSVALFELEDARTPPYAVVDASVSTVKQSAHARAGGLVNAVLRRYLRERAATDAAIARDPAARHATPAWLAERLRADWPEHWTQIIVATDAQAPMWLRIDGRRTTAQAYAERLRAAGIGARAAQEVPFAVVLDTPCDVGALPGFAQGLVSVQDIGAQCVYFPLALAANQRVLDACAAPGGKTALIAERQADIAHLVAVDIDRARLERVDENLRRGGLHAQLVVGDAGAPEGWWDGRPFDRILLDAPCSALGVIRRHPDIRLRRCAADLPKNPGRQARLLAAAWSMLAPGGRLVYSTCTVTRAENHDLVAAFLEGTPDARVVPPAAWHGWPGFGQFDGLGMQILPGEAGADGFYYAALGKR